MQSTNDKGAGKIFGRPHRGRIGNETFTGGTGRKKNNTGGNTNRCGFLNQHLENISIKSEQVINLYGKCFSEENCSFLVKCAVNYAGLLGKTIEIPTGTVYERFSTLYHRFAEILPAKHGLNFEIVNDRLNWVIYHVHDWSINVFHWMPVRFITLLTGEIREIAMSFMHLFIRGNGMIRFSNQYESEFLFEWFAEINHANGEEEMNRENRELIQSYRNGEISHFLDEIYSHNPIDVEFALKQYNPANPAEAGLIDCFIEGLPFISGNNCIMDYYYDPDADCFPGEDADITPLEPDKAVRYIYEIGDIVTNELECVNEQYLQETYMLTPTSYQIPDLDSKQFEPDDYPDRFSKWFLKMVSITLKITDSE